jgi:hypothetical protein
VASAGVARGRPQAQVAAPGQTRNGPRTRLAPLIRLRGFKNTRALKTSDRRPLRDMGEWR